MSRKKAVRGEVERDRIVLQWQYLPARVVRSWRRAHPARKVEYEEAVAGGMLGLIRAAELWDERLTSFGTFAWPHVWVAVTRAWRDSLRVAVPRSFLDRKYVWDEDTWRALQAGSLGSLEPTPSDTRGEWPGPADLLDLTEALAGLPSQWREVVRRRLGGQKFEEIGKAMGFTRQYAQQVMQSAVRSLWRKLGSP